LYSTQLGTWTENRKLAECTIPGLIYSVNIFEIAVDVAEQFKKHFDRFSSEDYVLTVFRIFSEKENPTPLFWHTDNRDGMVRAIIYLKGGKDNSGKLMYMKGTHDRDYYVEHKLSEDQIRDLQETKIEATVPEGSLMIFDSKGFHAKKECSEERRIMFLEFNLRNNQYCKERILLPSNHITEKVVNSINLFANIDFKPEDFGNHGHECALQNPQALPLKTSLMELKKSVFHTVMNSLKKTLESLPPLKKFISKFK
jgi:hypothetical protein